MPRRERECIKGAKEEEEWGTWRAPKPELARANSRVGAPSWRANLAVGAPTLELARAILDGASVRASCASIRVYGIIWDIFWSGVQNNGPL